jgi:hypothetical protein
MDDEILGYICPLCKTPSPANVKYCVKCGQWLLSSISVAKPLTKEGYRKYFDYKESNAGTNNKSSYIVWIVLSGVFVFSTTNIQILLGLFSAIYFALNIIYPFKIFGINSRRKATSIFIVCLFLFVFAISGTPATKATQINQPANITTNK